jgi:hypothetical protein
MNKDRFSILVFTWVKIGMLVFKPIIIKFDIFRFSNWELDWKPIQKWALFENRLKLEKTSNKSTFLWDFHIFENHNYTMPKLILKIWKLVGKWAYTQVAI